MPLSPFSNSVAEDAKLCFTVEGMSKRYSLWKVCFTVECVFHCGRCVSLCKVCSLWKA
jgi:ferredoxin